MAKITTFDKRTCREIADRITAALAPLAAELGVAIKAAGGSFSAGQYTAKIEISTISADGAVQSRAAEDFKRGAFLFGLAPDDIGRTFVSGGRAFTVAGLRPRAHKRPVLATYGGKSFCFAAEDVKRMLGAATK